MLIPLKERERQSNIYEGLEKTRTECATLCYFINLSEESATVAREETVRLVEKLLPYLILRNEREF